MNIQEIIESGIIELYVMNALPEDETAEVEALAVEHPEIRMEIESVQDVLQLYAEAHAIEPFPKLKNTILEKIKAENELSSQNPETPVEPQTSPLLLEMSPMDKGVLTDTNRTPWITWLAAAASVIAIVLFFQNINHKKALTDCAVENTKLIENQKVIVQLEHKLNILRSPYTKIIDMKGLEIDPNAKVLVYWNAKENATLLSIQILKQPNPGKQYQLWAIVDKKPVSAGVFTYDVTAVQEMKAFEHAEAFAVTEEPEGGSLAPTLDKMHVLGTVL